MRASSVKKAGLAAGFVFIACAMLWVRAFYGSMKAFEQGEICLTQNEYIRAVTFFDRSIRWYTPFNPYVRKSAAQLWEIGVQAEREDNIRLALIAMRTIKQGFYAARSFYTPGKDWIEKAQAKIDHLADPGVENKGSPGHGDLPHSAPFGAQSPKDPSIPWSLALELGFFGWIGSVFGFIAFAITGKERLRIRPSRAALWGGLVVICFALWVVGMMKA